MDFAVPLRSGSGGSRTRIQGIMSPLLSPIELQTRPGPRKGALYFFAPVFAYRSSCVETTVTVAPSTFARSGGLRITRSPAWIPERISTL